jgi:DNA-binding CsgD family transcriptional regulator
MGTEMTGVEMERFTEEYLGHREEAPLTRRERAEVVHLLRGLRGKDAAAGSGLTPETVRARRKTVYSKLRLEGHLDLLSDALRFALRRAP